MTKESIIVTGGNGFVGRRLVEQLTQQHSHVTCIVRSQNAQKQLPSDVHSAVAGDFGPGTDWLPLLGGAGVVVHLAARVHMMNDDAADPLAEFRRVNVEATRHLISQCADAGVKRFVFLSSVKAVGEGGPSAYSETDPCDPQDPYGVSKMEAEEVVRAVGRERGIETVILRPTVVYGPRVRANILRLMKLVQRGVPLPLGAVRNRRSLVYVGNLVSAIETCLTHPKAAGQTFFVADEPPLSTGELVEGLARHMDKRARLLPVPAALLRGAGRITGKSAEVDRLIGSLAVDTTKIRNTLGWTPPYSTDEGLRATVEWFLQDAAAQPK